MASFKLDRILAVTTLVCCVLIGTAASDSLTRDELMLQWNHEPFEGKNVYKMLGKYENRQDKIDDETVEELFGMCRMSLKNCILRLPKESNSPLFRYAQYCKEERLKGFCLDHYQSLLVMVQVNMRENEQLAYDFLKQLPEMGPERSRLEDSDIKQAFWSLVESIKDESRKPQGLDEKKSILANLKSTLEQFFDISFLADHYRKSQAEQMKKKPFAPWQENEWWKLMYASLDFERIAAELESELSESEE